MRKEWLAMMTGCLLVSTSSATVISGGIDYPSIWACEETKFHWYCDVEPEVTPEIGRASCRERVCLYV